MAWRLTWVAEAGGLKFSDRFGLTRTMINGISLMALVVSEMILLQAKMA